MDQAKPLAVSFRRLLAFVAVAVLAVAAVGAYPIWRLAGMPGLLAGAVAGSVILLVMIASAAVVVQAARRSATAAMVTFLVSGAARMVLAAVLIGVAMVVTDLPAVMLLVWLLVFYLATLAAEGAWLSGAMRRAQNGVETESGQP